MENVLDHPVITVEGERTLKHDRGTVHHTGLHPITLLIPEIDINSHEIATALWTFFTGPALDVHEGAAIAGSHVIDDKAFGRWLLNPPQQMHQDALACPAPPNDSDDLPFRDLE
jgi:hypothetical protein